MSAMQAGTVWLTVSLSLASAAAVRAGTLCATDSLNGTILLKTDTDPAANAVIGLHGWLSSETLVPVYGTAVVDAEGASMKIAIQGINDTPNQHLGVVITTDLTLNGSGTFANVNSSRPFTYQIVPVTWTTLDPCPAGPPSSLPVEAGKALSGDGAKTAPFSDAAAPPVRNRRPRSVVSRPTLRGCAVNAGCLVGNQRMWLTEQPYG